MGLTKRERIRVVMILHTFMPESYGGAEQQSKKLGRELIKQGVGVMLLAPRVVSSTPKSETMDGIDITRFDVKHLPNLGGRFIFSWFIWTLKTFIWLKRHSDMYDVIHIIHGRLHAVGPVLAGYFSNKPVIIKPGRGGDQFDLIVVEQKKIIGSTCARLIKKYTNYFIANSIEIQSNLKEYGIQCNKIKCIPNGVVCIPNSIIKRTRTSHKGITFVYAGRLSQEKNIGFMLKGFATINKSINCKLVIIGDGPCEKELKDLAYELKINDDVLFIGKVKDIIMYLKDADFYLSTSISEGMSNSLLEAMSFGVIPIVSRVSGVEELVINEKSGFTFESNNFSQFIKKLNIATSLNNDNKSKIISTILSEIKELYDIQKIGNSHFKLYKDITYNWINDTL